MDRIETAAREVIEMYDAYRGHGVLPAQEAYQAMVDAIDRMRAALEATVPPGDAVERAAEEIHKCFANAAACYSTPEAKQVCEDLATLSQSFAYHALEAAGPWQGWRDIASAPKDRTRILLLEDGECVVGRWCDDGAPGFGDAPGWLGILHDDSGIMELQPTHWQPLPSPPGSASPAPEGERCTFVGVDPGKGDSIGIQELTDPDLHYPRNLIHDRASAITEIYDSGVKVSGSWEAYLLAELPNMSMEDQPQAARRILELTVAEAVRRVRAELFSDEKAGDDE